MTVSKAEITALSCPSSKKHVRGIVWTFAQSWGDSWGYLTQHPPPIIEMSHSGSKVQVLSEVTG